MFAVSHLNGFNADTQNLVANFIALSSGDIQATSNDGIRWTRVGTNANLTSSGNYGVITLETGDKWLLIQDSNTPALLTRDGFTTLSTSTLSGMTFYDVCYGNGTYAVVGSNLGTYFVAYNTDFFASVGDWNSKKVPLPSSPVSAVGSAIDYKNGLFIVIDGKGRIHTSSDAITWTQRYDGAWANQNTRNEIEYGNGHYVIRGTDSSTTGEYVYSSDGVTWAAKSITGFTTLMKAMIYWNGTWYVFSNTQVATTTTPQTGSSWAVSSVTYGLVESVRSVGYNATHLVISGNETAPNKPAISYSTNGTSWTACDVSVALGTAADTVQLGYIRT